MDEKTYKELKEQYPELHAIYGPSGEPLPCPYCEENDLNRCFGDGGEGGIMLCYGCGRMWDRETGHGIGKLDGPREYWASRAMIAMVENGSYNLEVKTEGPAPGCEKELNVVLDDIKKLVKKMHFGNAFRWSNQAFSIAFRW